MKLFLSQLTKTFRDGHQVLKVLDNLTHDFSDQESVAILGKSGIGKSTLLHILAGIEKSTSGEIHVDQWRLDLLNENQLADYRRDTIGLIFQFHHLLSEFNALENVMMPMLIKGHSEAQAKNEATQILTAVGLADRIEHRPGELSGGEQQRVAIARALVHRPKLLLADEPTGSLDQETSEQVGKLLIDLAQQRGALLIAVTHSLDFAAKFSNVYRMSVGGQLSV